MNATVYQPSATLSGAALAWINRLSAPRQPWTGKLGDRALSITPTGIGRDRASADPMLDLVWAGEGGTLVLALSRRLAEELALAVQPGLALPDDPTRSLLIELALEPLLQAFEERAGGQFQLVRTMEHEARGPSLDFDIAYGRATGQARLFLFPLSAAALPAPFGALADLLAGFPPRPRELPADLPILVAGEIGALRLAASALRGVRPGDILLPDDCPLSRGQITIVAGRLWAPADLQDSKLHVRAPFRLRPDVLETPMMTPQGGASPAQPASGIDDIEITLTFELGRWPISLGDMKAMGEGHIVDLGRPLDGPVDVLANGRRIGRGEIVRVGDTLGIRLLEGLAHD